MAPFIAYIHLHRFYALLEAKRQPELWQVPFVVTRAHKVIDVSPKAANLGIHAAMGLRQARLICPNLEVIEAQVDPKPAVEQFRDICADLTPLVEPESDLSVFLDLSGLGEPAAVIERVVGKLRWQLAFPWQMGVASSKLVARIACGELINHKQPKAQRNCLVLSPAEVEAFLAPLAVNRLWPWPDKTYRQLQNLGIYTIGQLAKVPHQQLQAQLGEIGGQLYDAARGVDLTPVQGLYPPQTVQGYFQLPPDVEGCQNQSTLNRHLLPILQAAVAQLQAKDQACTRLRLFIQYDGYPEQCWDKELKHALQTEGQLLQVIQGLLIQTTWPAPITGIRLMLMGLKPAALGQAIFAPQILGLQRRTELQQTLTLLQAKFGNGSIFLAADMAIPRRERMLQLLTEYH